LDDARKAAIEAYQQKNFQKAFDLSEVWLKECPVDADVHFICAAAANQLGDISSTEKHMYDAYGLLASITSSGDGKSPKTAFKVISVAEEYSLLNDFGAKVLQQSLVDGPCDKMECELPNGSKVTYFFNVALSMAAMERQLGEKK
jgi:hypothetical protein